MIKKLTPRMWLLLALTVILAFAMVIYTNHSISTVQQAYLAQKFKHRKTVVKYKKIVRPHYRYHFKTDYSAFSRANTNFQTVNKLMAKYRSDDLRNEALKGFVSSDLLTMGTLNGRQSISKHARTLYLMNNNNIHHLKYAKMYIGQNTNYFWKLDYDTVNGQLVGFNEMSTYR